MMNPKFRNALISVSDKTGLVDFVKPLAAAGMRVLSTGGTAKHLRDHGITVVDVSEQTGAPEVMDGRVKTLHPNIHMALLARAENTEDHAILKQHGLEPIDLVIVNLYPFEEALSKTNNEREQIEFIDVGGPSMLRAAAKNFSRITVVCDPADYSMLAIDEPVSENQKKQLASKVFSHCATYDSMIASFLGQDIGAPEWALGGRFVQPLRYGENPQQNAAWYRLAGGGVGLHSAEILQGKALSYNNLLDLDAAVNTLNDLVLPACVAVKHNNPCGVAHNSDLHTAVEMALNADSISVFGGIVAINRPVDERIAQRLSAIFLECVVAPEFSAQALELFSHKRNLRILKWPEMAKSKFSPKVRSILGGFLTQTPDKLEGWSDKWQIQGDQPTPQIKEDLMLAWKVCARLKSNAIAIVGKGQTVGLGMGQVNRVDAVAQAIQRWQTKHGRVHPVVLASDAFFPFPDSVEKIASSGIRWVIQPGGSMRDEEVLSRAKALGVHMVLTGTRHFSH